MIPASVHAATVSAAERRVFELLERDPATSDWVVLHSLGLARRGHKPYGEIDFVVLIPRGGVVSLEVKGGRVACRNGEWETTNRHGRTERLKRSPFLQAREGMFALRDSMLSRAPLGFPVGLVCAYGVVLPDIVFRQESPEWEGWQVVDRDALAQPISASLMALVKEQRKLHPRADCGEPSAKTLRTVQQLLRPDFELVVSRGATIEDTEAQLLQLTEEQFDALDLLADNERCLFEGAAGTGKTMLALEYARRSCAFGQRTLLICFNRLLGDWLVLQAAASPPTGLRAGSYFRLLREVIVASSIGQEFLQKERSGSTTELYQKAYSVCGRLAVEEADDPYDVLVVDEAQDLLEDGILEVLDSWLKRGLRAGRWAFFGDFQRQAIYSKASGDQLRERLRRIAPDHAKGRLSFNCRNTRNIGEETALLSGFTSLPYRMGQVVGVPVDYRYYSHADRQAAMVDELLRALLAEGVRPRDMILLSPHRLAKSGLAQLDGRSPLRLVDVPDRAQSTEGAISFCTAGAFKGMESPVVILCDISQVGDDEPQSLLYVAMSRARSQLVVLAHEACRPSIAECVRRRLQEGWGAQP